MSLVKDKVIFTKEVCNIGYGSIHGLLKVWTEGYSEHSPNSGHEIAIYVLCWHNYTKSAYFMIFFVSSISYRPTDLSLF